MFAYAFLFKAKAPVGTTTVTNHIVKSYVLWNVFLTIYVIFLLFVFGHGKVGSHESTNDYINMVIVLPLFYYAGRRIFKDLEELMWVLCAVGLIQSVIIIIGTISPEVTTLLKLINSDSAFAENERMEYMMASGYHLGFKCFTSLGSLQMSLSQIAAWYFIEKKGSIYALGAFIIISFSSILLSRTGLLIAIVCIVLILFDNNRKSKLTVIVGTAVAILSLIVLNTLSIINITDFVDENFNRVRVLFKNGLYESYFKVYMGRDGDIQNVIPPISIYTIMGTGITNGVSGAGIEVACDGAFLRNYAAMGLIVAIINYLLLFRYYIRIQKVNRIRLNRLLILLMSITWFIGEFKEYFTYQIYYMCFLMVIFSFVEKERKVEITLK